jgi:hypothetical protein
LSAVEVAHAYALHIAQVAANDASIALGQYGNAIAAATGANTIGLDAIKAASTATVTKMQDDIAAADRAGALTEAQNSLAKANNEVGISAASNAKAIRDATTAVNDARQNERDVAVTNSENIITAEKNLANAQVTVKQAQIDLTASRVEAAKAIRDLTAAAEDAKRAQEDSRVSLIQQSQAYDEVMANSASTDLEKRDALAKLNDAQGASSNADTAAAQAIKDRDKAIKDGVDKSAVVLAAQKALTTAVEGQKKAVDDLAKAHKDAAKATLAAAVSSQKAQESLTGAYQTASTARVAALDAVKSAADRVRKAHEAIKVAAAQLKDKKIQLTVVPVIAGTWKIGPDGLPVFVPSAAPAVPGKGSVAAEPSRGGPGVVGRTQKGWRIPGYGGGDTVPILAERGESVIPKHLTPEIAPWAKAHGIPGFATGGVVGDMIKNTQGWIRAQDPKPYVYGAGGPDSWDCSSLTSGVFGLLTGKAAKRYFTTRSDFAALGFKPGKGAYTIGVNPGTHMAGNLSGLAFEAQQPSTGIVVGPRAQSVDKFQQQWYLPQIPGGFAGSGVSGGPVVGRQAMTMSDVNVDSKSAVRSMNRSIVDTINDSALNLIGKKAPARTAPYNIGATVTAAFKKLSENLGSTTDTSGKTTKDTAKDAGVATSHAANQALGKTILNSLGWNRYWNSYNSLVMGESGWDNTAQNPSSTAYGIGQFLNCVPMDTEILTRDGWKSYDQVCVGDETLGYNPHSGQNEWTPVLTKLKKRSESVVSMKIGNWESRSTPGHRWWSERVTSVPVKLMASCPICGAKGGKRGKFVSTRAVQSHIAHEHGMSRAPQPTYRVEEFVQTDSITKAHRLRVSAPAEDDRGNDKITEDEAALLGWIVGEGQVNYEFRTLNVKVYQSKPKFIPTIDTLLEDIPHSRYVRDRNPGKYLPETSWRLSSPYARDLFARSKFEELTPDEFVLSLSTKQRARWLEAIYQGEGTAAHGTVADGLERAESMRITQNVGLWADAITLAIYLEGYRPTRRIKNKVKAKPQHSYSWHITYGRPWIGGTEIKYEDLGEQPVWCVETGLGTWTMRQNGLPILTGNSTWGGVGGIKTSDAGKQITYMLKYIKQSYGDPANAFSTWSARQPHWYDVGGMLPSGTTMAINSTGRPERILTPAETSAYAQAERTGKAGQNGITADQLRQAMSGVATVENIREALSGMEFRLDERGVVKMVTKGQTYINTKGGRQ